MSFSFHVPTNLVFGQGAIQKLHKQRLPGKHALIVISSGKSTRANGYLDIVQDQLTQAGVTYTVFDKILANPVLDNVMDGAACARANGCDFVLGLGGGSSDAASALLALRKLYAPALPDTELETMAAALGSDVPFFIRGGTQLATGRGEVLSPLPPLTDGWFVIVKPTESFSTPAMYRRLDNLPPACTPPLPPLQGGLPALAAGLFNRFEAAIPAGSAVWDIKARLAAYGALASLLSGSGSAVFGLFDTETAARAAVEALRPAWPEIFLARPV